MVLFGEKRSENCTFWKKALKTLFFSKNCFVNTSFWGKIALKMALFGGRAL